MKGAWFLTSKPPMRVGVAGLGRAFVLTLPSFKADPRVKLVACAAPRQESRDAFRQEFGGNSHATVDAMCADPSVEAVYIATPHQLHREHAEAALRAGKHVLVDKPLCVSLQDALAIAETAEQTGRHVVVGPSHSFDLPVLKALEMIESGSYGRVRMIHALNYTDFLYRPRRPEELVTDEGGGVVFSQAVHQVDIVRLLGGGMVSHLRASTGQWDAERPTECAYAAHLTFEGGAFASMTYSGFAHFDSNEYCGWTGELGHAVDPKSYGGARRALMDVEDAGAEARLKSGRTFGAAADLPWASENEHFGPVIVSCDRADLRLTPKGIWVYGHIEKEFVQVPVGAVPRRGVIDALWSAVRDDKPAIQDARWGAASLEVCHGILASARQGREVALEHQVPVRGRTARKPG